MCILYEKKGNCKQSEIETSLTYGGKTNEHKKKQAKILMISYTKIGW